MRLFATTDEYKQFGISLDELRADPVLYRAVSNVLRSMSEYRPGDHEKRVQLELCTRAGLLMIAERPQVEDYLLARAEHRAKRDYQADINQMRHERGLPVDPAYRAMIIKSMVDDLLFDDEKYFWWPWDVEPSATLLAEHAIATGLVHEAAADDETHVVWDAAVDAIEEWYACK